MRAGGGRRTRPPRGPGRRPVHVPRVQVNAFGDEGAEATRAFRVDTTPPAAPAITARPPFPACNRSPFALDAWSPAPPPAGRCIGAGGAVVIGPRTRRSRSRSRPWPTAPTSSRCSRSTPRATRRPHLRPVHDHERRSPRASRARRSLSSTGVPAAAPERHAAAPQGRAGPSRRAPRSCSGSRARAAPGSTTSSSSRSSASGTGAGAVVTKVYSAFPQQRQLRVAQEQDEAGHLLRLAGLALHAARVHAEAARHQQLLHRRGKAADEKAAKAAAEAARRQHRASRRPARRGPAGGPLDSPPVPSTISFARGPRARRPSRRPDRRVRAGRPRRPTASACCPTAPATATRRCASCWPPSTARTPDQVLVTNGSLQGFVFLLETLLEPGDLVAVEAPTYDRALLQLRLHGMDVLPIPVEDDGMDVEALRRGLRGRPRAEAALHDPQLPEPVRRDPVGREAPRPWSRSASAHDILVLEDDPYGKLRFEGEPLPGLVELAAPGRVHLHLVLLEDRRARAAGGLPGRAARRSPARLAGRRLAHLHLPRPARPRRRSTS